MHKVNTTLTIRKVTMSDSRRYVCAAWSANSWIDIPEDTVQLTVLPRTKTEEKVKDCLTFFRVFLGGGGGEGEMEGLISAIFFTSDKQGRRFFPVG